jgi:hypothetical protein
MSLAVMVSVVAFAGTAQSQDKLQKHFSEVATKVKATDDPSQKRAILEESLEKMTKALTQVQGSPLVSKEDKAGIDQVKAVVKEKQDELAGTNGFAGITDAQLNAFADYVVQDMEQADKSITISVVTLLLIIILVILIA